MTAQSAVPDAEFAFQVSGTSADEYERYLVPVLHEPWAARLVDMTAVRAGDRLIDIACGTGIAARIAADRIGVRGAVTGVDVNPGMLAVAARTHPNITWCEGDAVLLPVPDDAFDAAVCQQGLQFFADRAAALREIHRVLVPGGRLALSVWRSLEHHPVWTALAEAIDEHIEDESRSPFPDWSIEDLRSFVVSAGFVDVRINIGIGTARFPSTGEFLRRVVRATPLAEPVAALATADSEHLRDAVSRSLAAHVDDAGVVFAMQTYLVHARRRPVESL